MLGYILAAAGGYFVGVLLTCILLAKKNLQTYQAISEKTESSFKNNVALAKVAYKSYVEEYEASECPVTDGETDVVDVDAEYEEGETSE